MDQESDDKILSDLQFETFGYFLEHSNPCNGLIADKTEPGSPASIAVIGMALSVYVVGVERGFLTRAEAVRRTLAVLRFLESSEQSEGTDATGYRGFYYHFLDMQTGRRANKSELSTIDTAFLMIGALTAAQYFSAPNLEEKEIGSLAEKLYRRVDWVWVLNEGSTLTHGWRPETGFLPYRWGQGYSEALLLYVLALGSPTFAISKEAYLAWVSTFEWKKVFGVEYLYAGPLFVHQFSHIWLDLREIRDDFMKKYRIDYFENSKRATQIHRQYAINNVLGFAHYGPNCWGLTASDGPGPARLEVNGIPTEFFDYRARGAPFGPDDGTIAPWAVVASLPFAPKIVIDTVRHAIERLGLKGKGRGGFDSSFNPTFPIKKANQIGWVSPWKFGINQGPIVLMIENFNSGLVWRLTRRCSYVQAGLCNAGFRGGWLESDLNETGGFVFCTDNTSSNV